jgi:hypothetical protein
MHNHVGHRWIKTFLKQLKLASRIYLSTAIVLSPIFFINSANASTLAGGSGWRVASTVANGVGVTVNGVKDVMVNGAKKTMTGVANVTPTASQVGKFMGKNVGAAAVIGAMDLLLDGVDYVLDPENNSIKYRPKSNIPYIFQCNYTCNWTATTQAEAQSKFLAHTKYEGCNFKTSGQHVNGSSSILLVCQIGGANYNVATSIPNPAYNPNDQTEQKSVPLVNLGSQVLDQAQTEVKTGNPAVPIATPITQAAATAVVGEAATDETQARPITAELDKSAAIPTTETAVGEIAPPTTNPDTGQANPTPLSLEFPVFCSWAPSMCVLADKVQQAITDATEWAKNDENQDTDNEPPEIKEIDIEALDTSTFTGVAGCPAPIAVPISFGDGGETEISYEPICQLAEKWSFVAPLIGFLSGAMIIVGVGRKGEDGEI